MERALEVLTGLPPALVYVVVAAGGAVENVLPALPADTFVLVGGFVAGLDADVDPLGAFAAVWAFNVAGAVAVYGAGLRYGQRFFRRGLGRVLIDAGQMRRLEAFYERWGVWAILFGRFLPGFRALVPVFAGVAGLGPRRVVAPLVLASALWYGALIRLGVAAGSNLEAAVGAVERANRGLLAASLGLIVLLAALWWRSRDRRGVQDRGAEAGESGDAP